MKKISIFLMVIAFFIAFYEQNKTHPNVFVTVIAVVVFMFGMLKLSSKIPSKNKEDDEY
jgi:hypothetical protein